MSEELILVGGGGHCRSCIDVIENKGISIAGILDEKLTGKDILGYKVLGSDDMITKFAGGNYSFLISVGQVKTSEVRRFIFERILKAGGKLALVSSSTAYVSNNASIGQGTIIMHHALINAAAVVGENCIINTKALVEHDCVIGDHTHISTGAVINGGCVIGSGVFIGSNAVINQGVQISNDVIIGAGSVVVKDIVEKGSYAGNPARKING